jgi:hypothetical protein
LTGLLILLAILHGSQSDAAPLAIEEVKLPPLRINGQQASAHTQGLETGSCTATNGTGNQANSW